MASLSPLAALSALHRRGGLTVTTPAEGQAMVRTLIQPGGDLVTWVTPEASEALVEAHLAAVQSQLAALQKARGRVVAALSTAVAGGALLTTGLAVDEGAWLQWLGGGACALPAGGALVAFWRIRRWLKGRGAFGPPRSA